MKARILGWLAVLILPVLGSANTAQQEQPIEATRGPDRIDVESTRLLRQYTTDPNYLTSWVDHVPASDTVPSPTKFLGHVVGTPDRLTHPDQIHAYFRALDQASDRVTVYSLGQVEGGREMILAVIAEAPLLARLDQITARNRELADPRVSSEERAIEISKSTPPLYWLTAGLHSPETGPPEMVMELAYRLAVSEQPHIQEIRKGVVTLITPVLEVAGRARMVEWYYRYLTKVTDFEDMPPRMAPYWGDYAAHDNNRDGLQQSQPLTRHFTDAYFRFLPVVSLDLHESVPLLYVSTGTGPYNETIDPITVTEWQWMASYDVSQATKLGLQGVWTWGFYDGWYPGYLLWVTNNHNATGRFYETFGNGHPGTWPRELKNSEFAGRRVNARQWYRPWPPDKKLVWSLRNNTNYMQTGVLAALQLAARNGDTLLYNFWRKSKNSLERGRTQKPYAYRIPAEQRDRAALHHLLGLLSRHRIEVHRATADADLGKKAKISSGDYVVRMDQPYRNFACTLLEKTNFPKTAEHPPYDDVAWSYDLMLGLEIQRIDDKRVQEAAMERLEAVPDLPGTVADGKRWLVEHRAQRTLASLRWALPEASVSALAEPWDGHPAGSLLIEKADRKKLEEACARLHLDALALKKKPEVRLVGVNLPRIALFHTWRYTQDSGWARYTLEQLEIPFTLINKDHLRAGGLRERFDVLLVPSQSRGDFAQIVHDIDPKWGPMPYTKTEQFPSHGGIDQSPDITGGMGFEGLANLQKFVEAGGVLVTLGSAGSVPVDGGLVRRISSARPGGTPGSHLTAKVLRPEHPLAWGYPEITWLFRGNLPVYHVEEHFRGMTVLQFGTKTLAEEERRADKKADVQVEEEPPAPEAEAKAEAEEGQEPDAREPEPTQDEDKPEAADGEKKKKDKKPPLLRAGLLKSPEAIDRKPALLDVPVGQGHVLLYAWNPLHRYQNHHDFAFVTNALLFFDDLPGTFPTEDEMSAREKPKKAPDPTEAEADDAPAEDR
jgi:hypothetical protein